MLARLSPGKKISGICLIGFLPISVFIFGMTMILESMLTSNFTAVEIRFFVRELGLATALDTLTQRRPLNALSESEAKSSQQRDSFPVKAFNIRRSSWLVSNFLKPH